MYSRLLVLFATLMALALFVAANPVPNPEGVVARKPLKQYDIKRAIADAKKRRSEDGKPSRYVYTYPPPPSPYLPALPSAPGQRCAEGSRLTFALQGVPPGGGDPLQALRLLRRCKVHSKARLHRSLPRIR